MKIITQYKGQNLKELHKKAEKLFMEGNNEEEIGKKVDRNSRTIRRWRELFGWIKEIKTDDYVYRKGYVGKRELGKQYYKEGDSPKRIANRLEISLGSVYNYRRQDNWEEK